MEERHQFKEKIFYLHEEVKREQRTSQNLIQINANLKLKARNQPPKQTELTLSEEVSIVDKDLEKQVAILMRAKESLQRKYSYQKVKNETRLQKSKDELQTKDSIIADKDKEIKLQQVRLREFLQKNMNELKFESI